MSDPEKYRRMIDDALAPLGEKRAEEIRPMVWALFAMIYDDLQKAVVGNPVEHHPIVLRHMIEISKGEKSPYIPTEQAVALGLLHDISAVDKITTQMVNQLRQEDTGKGEALELKRQQNRILHMREGAGMAHRRLLHLNESQGRIVFDAEAIDRVCEVIRIHDNPSLDIPIPRANWLAVAFREADRLWMLTHEGILADLTRKKVGTDDPEAFRVAYDEELKSNQQKIAAPQSYWKQLESNIERFREERSLYRPVEGIEGPFCDDETFFRTKTGYGIFHRLRDDGFKRTGQGRS